MSSAAGLAQEVLHTHYRLLDFRAKTTQDARHFFLGVFRGSANDRIAFRIPKVHYLPPSTTTPYFRAGFRFKHIVFCKQEMLANFVFGFLLFL